MVGGQPGLCGFMQHACAFCSTAELVRPGTITAGSQRSREGNYVSRSTKEGARARRNRTRAAITTAAALIATAALSTGAQAAVNTDGASIEYTQGRNLLAFIDYPADTNLVVTATRGATL